jgi:hypothetical protein
MRKLTVFVVLLAACGTLIARNLSAAACFQSFDGPQLTWQPVDERAGAQLVSHGCVGDDAREGSGSERVTITAPGGEALHFVCPVGRVPVLDEFEARMWVKANRPGVTLAARVVLPRTAGATNGVAKTVLVRGEQCEAPGRWQQLRLSGVPSMLAAQARVMRATTRINADEREAYVDAIVLVVPGGPNNTVAWTDALEVDGVVLPAAADSTSPPRATPAVFSAPSLQAGSQPSASTASTSAPPMQLQGTTLMVGGRPFLLRAIEWNHEPFAFLAARGFNAIWLDEPPTGEQAAEAARAGLWLIATPPAPEQLTSGRMDSSLDRVLAWHLGSPAGPRELEHTRRWAELVRSNDPLVARPILVTPRGDWLPASRLSDVLVADHPAAGTLSRTDFSEWLQNLPLLARPGTPFWAQILTQPGPRTRQQLAALSPGLHLPPTAIDEAQIEALVAAAGTNGCRGFLFQSDSPLDASDEISQRRATVLEKLNDQLELMSPWLTVGKRVADATSTDGTVTGIVLQAERARLLVLGPTDAPSNAAAAAKEAADSNKELAFIVPGVPESNEAFLLSPVSLQTLPSKRVAGGTRVVVDRNAEGWILMTEDPEVITGLRQRLARRGGRAAQLQFGLATNRSRSIAAAAARLQRLGVTTKSLDQAIGSANVALRGVNALLSAGKFEAAYQQSWAAAEILAAAMAKTRTEIAAGPELNSIPLRAEAGSLVRQAEFEKSLPTLRGSENQLDGGDFEDLEQLRRLGWQHVEDPLGGIQTKVQLSGRGPQEGRYCLELSAEGAAAASSPKIVARPLVWITSPPVRATAGEVLEISGWVRVSPPVIGSIDGLEIVDSLGGPELALRVRSTHDWQPFRMLRSTRETTEMTVTFALAGIGAASVDGVMVRTLAAPSVKRLPTVLNEPGPAFPNSARRTMFAPPIQR